jgi:hypothetical protein
MKLADFKLVLIEKSLSRTALPTDDKLEERIFAGLKLIAKETVVLRLIVKETVGYSILKRIDELTYIRMPEKTSADNPEIDTDLALIDALAYYVMAGLERANANTYMGMYHGEIDMNNDRLTETYLSTATNDSNRFCQFP